MLNLTKLSMYIGRFIYFDSAIIVDIIGYKYNIRFEGNKHMIKAIAVDMDGTFLDSSKQ